MIAWLESAGAIIAVGVAYSAVTSISVGRELQSAQQVAKQQGTKPEWRAFFLSGCIFALAIHPLIASLHLSTHWLILALWLLLFILGFLLSMLEAMAFTDGPNPVRARDIVGAMVAAAVAASVAGCLIKAPTPDSLIANLGQWVQNFGWIGLMVRLFGCAVAFMVAYCVIGSVTWRFVRQFYEDPKFGLRLSVPSGPFVVLLQLGRGLLAVLALVPLLASTTAHGFDWWARFAFALAVTSGVIPLICAAGWPTRLRLIHGVEIVVFELVYAFALLRILGT